MRKITMLLAAALIAMPISLLTACAPDASVSGAPSETAHTDAASAELSLHNGWAKSAKVGGMTGVFGTLTNGTSNDLVITSVDSNDAGMIELHEVTADGVMQAIEGDVVVPAHGSFELAPGANHIMLMDLQNDLLAGDEVTFTLHLIAGDGTSSAVEFTVLVKDYAGANEDYGSADHEGMDHEGMDHEGMDHGDDSHDSH